LVRKKKNGKRREVSVSETEDSVVLENCVSEQVKEEKNIESERK